MAAEAWARARAAELTSWRTEPQVSFWIGVLIFAVGILVSVCLHEAGHLLTAKRFGMKATQYFAGFGPTVLSFHRGETEYGFKAVPAGGFVKIVGMTPLEEVAAEDQHRAFWRYPLWQRTVVLAAGSAMHFVLALFIFYAAAVATGLPNPVAQSFEPLEAKPVIGQIAECIVPGYDVTKDGALRACRAGDPESAAGSPDFSAATGSPPWAGRPSRRTATW